MEDGSGNPAPHAATLDGTEFAIADLDDSTLAGPPDFGGFVVSDLTAAELDLSFYPKGRIHTEEDAPTGLEVRQVTDLPAGATPAAGAPLTPAPRARGLAMRELTLSSADPWVGERLYNWLFKKTPTADLYFVAIAIDGSNRPPSVWPLDPDTAELASKRIRQGESYKWNLGSGAPVYGPRVIEGGLAVSITVAESRGEVRQVGQVLSTVTKAFKDNSELMTTIATLAGGPAGFTSGLAAQATAQAMAIVAKALELTPDKRFGAYAGLFSATGSWRGKLRQADRGTAIRLVEVLE
jgi:hypothetical protein